MQVNLSFIKIFLIYYIDITDDTLLPKLYVGRTIGNKLTSFLLFAYYKEKTTTTKF